MSQPLLQPLYNSQVIEYPTLVIKRPLIIAAIPQTHTSRPVTSALSEIHPWNRFTLLCCLLELLACALRHKTYLDQDSEQKSRHAAKNKLVSLLENFNYNGPVDSFKSLKVRSPLLVKMRTLSNQDTLINPRLYFNSNSRTEATPL